MVSILNLMTSKYLDDVTTAKKSMIFWQVVSVAKLFAQFYAGTKKFLYDIWLPLINTQ